MKADDVYEIVMHFIDNEFAHLRKKVDWMFGLLVGALVALIVNLVCRLI